MPSKSKFLSLVEYYFVLFLRFILSLLPVYLFYKLAFVLSRSVYYLSPISLKSRLLSSFRIAFNGDKSDLELRSLLKEVFVYSFYSLFEMVSFPRVGDLDFSSRISFSAGSVHIINDLMSRGRGLILVSAHYGNWEYFGKAVGDLAYPVNVVYRPLDNEYLDSYVNSNRSSYASALVLRDEVYYRGLEVLSRNEILILLVDQHQARNGIEVSFFGKEVLAAKGPALLSYRTGAPIAFGWIERGADLFTNSVSFEELKFEGGGSYDDFVFAAVQSYTLFLEGIVRNNPAEWWWFHSRWRDVPKRF